MTILTLQGHPTWVQIAKKSAPTIALLHGGMSSSASMLRSIGPGLSKHYRIAAFDRRGHGRTADTSAPFSYDTMADETIAFLEYLARPAHVVGHSDGGVVALLVALRRPDLLRRVVVIGANYHFNGLRPYEDFALEGPDFDQWAQSFAAISPDGIEHARAVAEKTVRLLRTEPTLVTADLATISVPVLVMASDDEPIQLEHTCSLYESIPDAELAIIPGTSHAMLKERTKASVGIIHHFLRSTWPPVTQDPIRRAP
ncbi:MAG: alpha/beta hydrolase [Acidimicrobiales bacterium]|jgi:pimeloyl-ACP methyl ester carboxylesterase